GASPAEKEPATPSLARMLDTCTLAVLAEVNSSLLWLARLGVLRQLDGGRGPGGQVPDQALGRQVGQHSEEPVALADLLLGRRGEEARAAAGLLLAPGHVAAQQVLVAGERGPVVAAGRGQFPGQHVGRHYRGPGAVAAGPGGVARVADERDPAGRPPVQLNLAHRVEVEVGRRGHLPEQVWHVPADPLEGAGQDLLLLGGVVVVELDAPAVRGGEEELRHRLTRARRAEDRRGAAGHAVQQALVV